MSKIDITPTWLGRPMYPAGIPVNPWQIQVEGVDLKEYVIQYYEGTLAEDKYIYLKQYIKYYVNAPVFDNELTDELREKLKQLLSVEEMIEECMNCGLDPL